MIIVNANAGFQRMSREHLGIALALRRGSQSNVEVAWT